MSTMMKAMRFVGDLDDDFYKDERAARRLERSLGGGIPDCLSGSR